MTLVQQAQWEKRLHDRAQVRQDFRYPIEFWITYVRWKRSREVRKKDIKHNLTYDRR